MMMTCDVCFSGYWFQRIVQSTDANAMYLDVHYDDEKLLRLNTCNTINTAAVYYDTQMFNVRSKADK